MKILISGASGLVGKALTTALGAHGHTLGRLVRPGTEPAAGDVRWDPMSANIDPAMLEGTDAFVHLAGASIGDVRWTPERKAALRSSRIGSTRVLVDALARMRPKPKALVCASATGYYGDRGDEVLTESSSPGTDFLAVLARDWESEAMRAEHAGIRTVCLRYGLILSGAGGALPRMITPFKFGAGGRLGSGKQWMSWIALDDAIEITHTAITGDSFSGPLNVVAPEPVRNLEFTQILAKALRRPAIFPAPAFALRLMLGEMADYLVLSSQRVRPERLLATNFSYRFADLASALRSALPRRG